MKTINFIKPLPHKQQSSIKRWISISLALGSMLLVIISTLLFNNYWLMSGLSQEKKQLKKSLSSFDAIMQRKKVLKKHEETITQKINTLAAYSNQITQQAQLIAHSKKALKNIATLDSLTFDKNNLHICVNCNQTQHTATIINSLKQLPIISNFHMTAIQPKQQGNVISLRLNLRGTLKVS